MNVNLVHQKSTCPTSFELFQPVFLWLAVLCSVQFVMCLVDTMDDLVHLVLQSLAAHTCEYSWHLQVDSIHES